MYNTIAMESTFTWSDQLYSNLSNINHPLEGIFYLFVIGLIVRWRWPITWNNLLKRIEAETSSNPNLESDGLASIASSEANRNQSDDQLKSVSSSHEQAKD